jgi:hypothetical protein
MKVLDKIEEIEKETGRFVSSAEIRDGKVVSYELAPFGPDELVLNVWNCKGSIARTEKNNGFRIKTIYEDDSDRFQNWCFRNCYIAGGSITTSGIYPIIITIPKWLKKKILSNPEKEERQNPVTNSD